VQPELTQGDVGTAALVGPTVTSTDGALGTFLTDGDGRTLYLFTRDAPGVSRCDADCLAVWPPLLADGGPAADGAVDPELLGTLLRDDGSVQVTYAGWPLYVFVADASPGDTAGQGVDDVWFVVSPEGVPVTADGTAGTDEGMRTDQGTETDEGTETGGYDY
jgi:predicted lipoprotein with Yx(FWY)xxD motif